MPGPDLLASRAVAAIESLLVIRGCADCRLVSPVDFQRFARVKMYKKSSIKVLTVMDRFL